MASRNKKNVETILVTALAKGATVAQAAQKAGVSERTVYRRLKNPEFQACIDAIQEETIQRVAAILTAAAQQGVHSLVALQDPSTPPAVRRAAARDILDMALRLRMIASIEKRLGFLETHALVVNQPTIHAAPSPPGPCAKRRRRGDKALQLALASGATVTQAAASAHLSERTVYRRLNDPAFHQEIETLRADMVQRAAAFLIAATLLAANTLVDLQNSAAPASVRRRAARDILELTERLRLNVVIEKRLVALELQVNASVDT